MGERDDRRDVAPTAVRPAATTRPTRSGAPLRQGRRPAPPASPVPTWAQAHAIQLGIAAAAAVIVAIIVAVTAYVYSSPALPSADVIRQATFDKAVPPTWSAGDFEAEATMAVADVRPVESHLDSGSGNCVSTVIVTFAAGSVEATQEAQLTFTRAHDEWSCLAYVTDSSPSYRATAAAEEGRLTSTEGMTKLLVAADGSASDSQAGDSSLAYLYQGATATLTKADFDEGGQTEEVSLSLAKDEGWRTLSCDLTAQLRFVAASGAWEVEGAQVSDGARSPSYEPVVGTWAGAFRGQDSGGAGKCLAGRATGLTVVVSQAYATSSGGAAIEGALSGVAHFHGEVQGNVDATEGDQPLSQVAFRGTLDTDASTDGTLAFDCTTPDATDGTVTLRLQFGSADDASAVTATLTTTHPYQETVIFVPIDRTATFADQYTLTKE